MSRSADVLGMEQPALFQSPGLALAAARKITGHSALSACAVPPGTPSRSSHPARPPTPGAPGSNMRRTTSVIETLEAEEESGSISLTDALMSGLTQGFTAITIGAGSKRSLDERQ